MSDSGPSRIILNRDRTVTVILDDGQRIVLRPPTVEQWAELSARFMDAEAVVEAEPTAEDPRSPFRRVYGIPLDLAEAVEEAPLAVAFAELVAMLSDAAELSPARLPSWAAEPGLFITLYNHWKTVEVIEESPTDAQLGASASPITDSAIDGAPVPWEQAPPGQLPVLDLDALGAVPPPQTGGMPGFTGQLQPTA